MASIIEAVYTEITSDAGIMSILNDRFYYFDVPEGQQAPYTRMWLVDDPRDRSSVCQDKGGLARIQFDIYETDKIVAVDTRESLIDFVLTLRKASGAVTISDVTINRSADDPINESGVYHVLFDALFRYTI